MPLTSLVNIAPSHFCVQLSGYPHHMVPEKQYLKEHEALPTVDGQSFSLMTGIDEGSKEMAEYGSVTSREPWPGGVRFTARNGLNANIALSPKSANKGHAVAAPA